MAAAAITNVFDTQITPDTLVNSPGRIVKTSFQLALKP